MLWPNISTSRNLCVLNRLKYVHKRIFVVALFIKQKIRERKKISKFIIRPNLGKPKKKQLCALEPQRAGK